MIYWQQRSFSDPAQAVEYGMAWCDPDFRIEGFHKPVVLMNPTLGGGTLLLGIDTATVGDHQPVLPDWHVSALPVDLTGWMRIVG